MKKTSILIPAIAAIILCCLNANAQQLVKNINSGTNNSDPQYLTNVSGTLYFSADDGINGIELWKSDGTTGE